MTQRIVIAHPEDCLEMTTYWLKTLQDKIIIDWDISDVESRRVRVPAFPRDEDDMLGGLIDAVQDAISLEKATTREEWVESHIEEDDPILANDMWCDANDRRDAILAAFGDSIGHDCYKILQTLEVIHANLQMYREDQRQQDQ